MKTAMRETIGKQTNKKQARRKQGCCPDLIEHIARMYRSFGNDIPDSPFG